MNKQELIQRYFQRQDQLIVTNIIYREHLEELFQWMIKADHIKDDISVKALHIKGKGSATIIAKQAGVIAGIEEVMYLVQKYTSLTIHPRVQDGSLISSGDTILSLSGDNDTLLAYERVLVNIPGRMSGIATSCRDAINRVSTNITPPMIAATRKTPWTLLDKKAVAVGGGLTHRLHLADWPMIKDNHLKILEAPPRSGKYPSGASLQKIMKQMIHENIPFFEIEVATAVQAEEAVEAFTDGKNKHANIDMAIMLDNFNWKDASRCISRFSDEKNIIFEASGNITQKNLSDWATTGVDIISLGSLTHSSPNFDLSMRIL